MNLFRQTYRLVLLSILLAAFFGSFFSSYAQDKPPIAHYTFDGDANDHSGNGHHGVVEGARLTDDREGNKNANYHFNGVSDHIRIPDHEAFNLKAFTVTAWIKIDRVIGYTQGRVICHQEDGRKAWGIEVFGSGYGRSGAGNQLAFHANDGEKQFNLIGASTLEPGYWYEIRAVSDGDSLCLYVNDQLDAKAKALGPVYDNINGDLFIGKTNINTYYFPGTIDDVKIYDYAFPCSIKADETAKVTEPEPKSSEPDRILAVTSDFKTKQRQLKLFVWDHQQVDGDTIHLRLNGQPVLTNYPLAKTKKEVTLNLSPGLNTLELIAVNLGQVPPNTAALLLHDGTNRHQVVLSSSLEKTEAVAILLEE